jgi:prevent-host-death family protein
MRTATFTELRNNAKKYFDAVEKGETVEIYRHGKPVALLSPAVREDPKEYWKNAKPLFKLKGPLTAAEMIIQDREDWHERLP